MKYRIESMVCGGCVRSVTKIVQAIDPSATVEADAVARTADILSQKLDDITKALALAGFEAAEVPA